MPHELATVMLYDRFFWRKYCLKPLLCPGLVPGRLGRKGNFQKRFARPVGEFAPAPLLFFAGRRPYAASGYGSGDEFFSPEQRHYCSSGRTCFFRPPPVFASRCIPQWKRPAHVMRRPFAQLPLQAYACAASFSAITQRVVPKILRLRCPAM